MSKSKHATYAKQMPEVFKIIRSAALDEAYKVVEVINPYAVNSNESPSMKESALQAIEELKHV